MTIPASVLLLVDGRFPSGGHANSAGAEIAVRSGDIVDVPTMERYLRGRLSTTGITDAAFAARACAAGLVGELDLIAVLDDEYEARVASPRLRATSRQLGRQLYRTASGVWDHPGLLAGRAVPTGLHHAVMLGLTTAAADGSPPDAAALALHHTSGAVATASIRMLGLDPVAVSASQARVAADIDLLLADAPVWAGTDPADLPATTGSLTEILGEAHGQWDARLFIA